MCLDCHTALRDDPPPSPPPRSPRRENHGVDYDLADWDEDRRAALNLLLDGRDIPHGWTGATLTVAGAHEADADALIDELDASPAPETDVEFEAMSSHEEVAVELPLASLGQRLLGYVIDAALIAACVVVVGLITGDGQRGSTVLGSARVTGAVLLFFYEAICIGRWGQTVGKRVVGTFVVDAETGGPALWPQAAMRAAVPAMADFVALAPQADNAPSGLWFAGGVLSILVYVGVVFDERSQGLHDKAAGTLVFKVG